MTNELNFLTIITRNPLDPMILTLGALWLLSLCISGVSILVAIIRIAKRRSARLLANLNVLTAMILGLCSVATLLWMLLRVGEIQITSEPSDSMANMMSSYWMSVVWGAGMSIVICGINLIIGVALSLKWREPQPPPGN